MDNARKDRRQDDGRIADLAQQLNAHITDCTAQSRKLYWAVIGTLAWLVCNGLVLPLIEKLTH